MLDLDWRPLFQRLNPHIWRVPNHSIEPAGLHDCRKFCVPVEGVDPVSLLILKQTDLLVLIEVGADEGIAAFAIVAEVRQARSRHILSCRGGSPDSRLREP